MVVITNKTIILVRRRKKSVHDLLHDQRHVGENKKKKTRRMSSSINPDGLWTTSAWESFLPLMTVQLPVAVPSSTPSIRPSLLPSSVPSVVPSVFLSVSPTSICSSEPFGRKLKYNILI